VARLALLERRYGLKAGRDSADSVAENAGLFALSTIIVHWLPRRLASSGGINMVCMPAVMNASSKVSWVQQKQRDDADPLSSFCACGICLVTR